MYAIFYDAIRRFFARAKHEGNAVPAVFARPDRAHSELARIVAERNKQENARRRERGATVPTLPETEQAVTDAKLPVPFMSLYIQPPQFDPSRYSPATFRGITRDRVTGNATSMRYPRPVASAVQVDLWCGDDGGELIAHNIEAQIEESFLAESVYLPIDYTLSKWYRPPFNTPEHMRAFGRTRIRLAADPGWTDTSDLEDGGDGPKVTRRTWTGRMEAFIPYRPVEARLVMAVSLALYDGTDPESPELLAEQTKDVED